MYPNDITLNANAHTGVSLDRVFALQSGPNTNGTTITSTRSVAALANTTPLILDVQHTEVKRGGAVYVRSTVTLRQDGIPPTTANPEGVTSYSNRASFMIERPKLSGVITDTALATHLGQLLSFLGVTLSTTGVPSANLLKLFNKEC